MNTNKSSSRIASAGLSLFTIFLSLALLISQAAPAFANDRQKAAKIVEKARLTFAAEPTSPKRVFCDSFPTCYEWKPAFLKSLR